MLIGTKSADTECEDCQENTYSNGTSTSCMPHTEYVWFPAFSCPHFIYHDNPELQYKSKEWIAFPYLCISVYFYVCIDLHFHVNQTHLPFVFIFTAVSLKDG